MQVYMFVLFLYFIPTFLFYFILISYEFWYIKSIILFYYLRHACPLLLTCSPIYLPIYLLAIDICSQV